MTVPKKALIFFLAILIFSFSAAANVKSHFERGMAAFDRGAYSEAKKEFKASLKENPQSTEYRFYYALALYYTDDLKEARAEFKKISEESTYPDWRKAANSYIEAMDLGIFAPMPEKDIEGYLIIAFDNDDNITYGPTVVAGGQDNRSSSQLSVTYKPLFASFRPLSLSINANGSIYDKNTNYNMYGAGLDMALNVPLIWDSYGTLSYGSINRYLKYDLYYLSDYIEGRITFNPLPGILSDTSLYLGGANNLYKISTYEGYDGYETRFGLRQDLNSYLFVQYDYKASLTRQDDFSNRADEYSIGATIPFPLFHRLYITGKYTNKNFLYGDSISIDKKEVRHDNSSVFDLLFSRDLMRGLTLGLRYIYTKYFSSLDSDNTALGYGSYVDHVVSVSIYYKF